MSSDRPTAPASPGPRAATVAGVILLVLALLWVIGSTTSPADARTSDQSASTTAEPSDGASPQVRWSRLAGEDRLSTAVAISRRAFPDGADVVYLANGASMVDALAAGSLTDGPVLLVPACQLPDAVADEIARLRPSDVIALGGPAAVCDQVVEAAVAAAQGDQPADGDEPMPVDLTDVEVTATVEVRDASSTPPFTVDVTDPGIVIEGGTAVHQVVFTGTDGTVALDDPRFSSVMQAGGGTPEDGQMVVTGRGCGPTPDGAHVLITCQEDYLIVVVEEGEQTTTELTVHTDDRRVGPHPLRPGTYVLEQPIRWDTDSVDGEVDYDDGGALIRITYTVRPAA